MRPVTAQNEPHISGAWVSRVPERIIEPGHNAGDLLGAPDWRIIEEGPGRICLEVDLPAHLTNPRGQLFGGFTPTYVDLVSLLAVRAGPRRTEPGAEREWLSTINMRIDYLAPIVGPTFVIEADVVHLTARLAMVDTRFVQGDELAVLSHTTLRVAAPG